METLTKEQRLAAQDRIDKASEEADSFALDVLVDRALHYALIVRAMRQDE